VQPLPRGALFPPVARRDKVGRECRRSAQKLPPAVYSRGSQPPRVCHVSETRWQSASLTHERLQGSEESYKRADAARTQDTGRLLQKSRTSRQTRKTAERSRCCVGRMISVRSRSAIPDSVIKEIIAHVNRREWWHVPPHDPMAYRKRGKFFASSFRDAEFYGRPLDTPQHVVIGKPLVGDERAIAKVLGIPPQHEDMSLEEIAAHDVLWRNAALAKGFDSIVLMTPKAFVRLTTDGKLPRSLELNVLLG
jgi:hypothetical protein